MARRICNSTFRVMTAALAVGLAFWVFDALYDHLYFREKFRALMFRESLNVWDSLLWDVPPHDMVIRVAFLIACLSGGVLVSLYLCRVRQKNTVLAEREAQLKAAHRIARLGTWIWDLSTNRFHCSDELLHILQFTADAPLLPYDEALAAVHPEDRALFEKSLWQAVESDASLRIDYRVPRPDGESTWVHSEGKVERDGTGRPLRLLGISQDITERKRAEIRLRESEVRLQSIVARMPVLLDAYDAKGTVIAWNEECERVTGYGADEIVGNPRAMELLYPDPDHRAEVMRRVEAQDGDFRDIELELTAKNGEKRIIAWSNLSASLPIAGWDTWAVGVDVTERKRLEEKLRQTQKMEAIGQLAGGVAHDFNNQLAGIMGFAEILSLRLKDETLKKHAENILTASQHAADLTAQLLAFARRGRFQSVVLDLHHAIAEVADILEHTIDKRIVLRQTLQADPALTRGDPTQIQNALLNLALNARDAMPSGGELIFETHTVDLDAAYCRTCPFPIEPGRYVQVAVSDNGCGMDAETQKRMFEPFFTTKPIGAGTGMGLAAVYGTLRAHQGAVTVYSEPGWGTTFRLYFRQTAVDAVLSKAADVDSPPPREARILLVDDEQAFRDAATAQLRDAGYKVVTCENGREAVRYYEKSWQFVDLVILDMVMPQMSGREAFVAMREIHPGVRALLASGFSLNGEAQSILDEGVLGFLQKPFRREALLRAVAQALTDPDSA